MYQLVLAAGRALLKARGPDVMPLLHSLATNDIHHLQSSANCLYSMFLNARGRVLFDTIIYPAPEYDTLLIDCDKTLLSSLQKHLNMYKLKKKVQIEISDHEVWLLFDSSVNHDSNQSDVQRLSKSIENFPYAFVDPRSNLLGARLLFPKHITSSKIIDQLNVPCLNKTMDEEIYRNFRYKLGIPENSDEISFANSFPLEVNCDFMHGVSFHKGCYIGQELTARTHHTGVVRKRIMPLLFERNITSQIPYGTPICNPNTDKIVGKIRGVSKNAGIGLLRINEALAISTLKILNYNATTFRPKWWPIEASKEKPN